MRRVLEQPFRLAYSIFANRLVRSTHWLLTGYGLADIPVNETLARAACDRHMLQQPTTILVQLKGDGIDERQVRTTLSLDASHGVILCLCGLPDALGCDHWRQWG